MPPRPRRGRATPWFLCCLLIASAGLATAYFWFRRPATPDRPLPPADPRRTYTGPYRNIHPDVRYVGDAACATCHSDECDKFHQHAMGRSILTLADWTASRNDALGAEKPFEALGSRFEIERQGQRVWHKQEHRDKEGKVVTASRSEVQYVIGSGHRGHSFFTARDGFLYQTPISWFAQKGSWDLSPGFASGQLRPVTPECLFCHASGAKHVEQSRHRYETPIFTSAAISCERCHGPAELHVEERSRRAPVKGLPDHTIVNPKHLTPELREDVCHQCHLSGEVKVPRRGRDVFDYRPGLPLPAFWSVYVATADVHVKQRAVGHVEQLAESKCFTKSAGRLGCATCHDPHERLLPEQQVSHHREKCLSCHETDHPCSVKRVERLKKSKADSCIECHMKRLNDTDIAHTAVTDHRILRVPRKQPRSPTPETLDLPLIPLELFHKGRRGEADADRDLGMALVRAAQRKPATFSAALPRALVLLERARKEAPDDVPMLENMSECLLQMGLKEKALEVSQHVLALQPRNAQALFLTGQVNFHLNDFERAATFLEKARTEEPGTGIVSSLLALSLVKKGEYERASGVCKAWLESEAGSGEVWAILAHCQRKLGKPEAATESQRKAEGLGAPKFVE